MLLVTVIVTGGNETAPVQLDISMVVLLTGKTVTVEVIVELILVVTNDDPVSCGTLASILRPKTGLPIMPMRAKMRGGLTMAPAPSGKYDEIMRVEVVVEA